MRRSRMALVSGLTAVPGVMMMMLGLAAVARAGGPPAHDACADALPIAVDELVTMDTTLATTDGAPTVGCFFNTGQIVRDVWYIFTAAESIEYRATMCGSAYDSRLAVYEGCACGAISDMPIGCDDDFCDPGLQSEVDFTATAGQCYLVRVGGYVQSNGMAEQFGMGQLLITAAPSPPANDLCADAIPIELDTLVFGTTTDATEDKEFTGCDTGFITYNGVWYSVVGTGTSMTASTCGSDFDTRLTVFCGGCDMDICARGNDNFNCTPAPPIEEQSRVVWCSTAGEEYRILVHGGLGDYGDFQLQVTANAFACSFPQPCALPVNDECGSALVIDEGIYSFDTRLATTDGPEHKMCDLTQPQFHQDLWFLYEPECTGIATISTCDSGFDTKMAIYSAHGCDGLDARLLNCNDDFDCNGNGPDINDRNSQIELPVACGLTYLIRIGGDFPSDAGGGFLSIICNGQPCPGACVSDLNDDQTVDVFDLLELLSAWGPCDPSEACPPNCVGDIDPDCTVNVHDLLDLLGDWGPCD